MSSTTSSVTVVSTAAAPVPSSAAGLPCAACKFLRRKCQPDCVFAPYFPPDQPQKFVRVHKVFGASNVTKLLSELTPFQREDAVNSLAYEAEMRLRDPVYGCVGVISLLHHQLRQLQLDLSCARSELSRYRATAALSDSAAVGPGLGLVKYINSNLQYPTGMLTPGVERRAEQLLVPAPARELHHHQRQHYHHYCNNLMAWSYDAEMAARLGTANGGVCDAGFMAAMTMSAGVGSLGTTPLISPRRGRLAETRDKLSGHDPSIDPSHEVITYTSRK